MTAGGQIRAAAHHHELIAADSEAGATREALAGQRQETKQDEVNELDEKPFQPCLGLLTGKSGDHAGRVRMQLGEHALQCERTETGAKDNGLTAHILKAALRSDPERRAGTGENLLAHVEQLSRAATGSIRDGKEAKRANDGVVIERGDVHGHVMLAFGQECFGQE